MNNTGLRDASASKKIRSGGSNTICYIRDWIFKTIVLWPLHHSHHSLIRRFVPVRMWYEYFDRGDTRWHFSPWTRPALGGGHGFAPGDCSNKSHFQFHWQSHLTGNLEAASAARDSVNICDGAFLCRIITLGKDKLSSAEHICFS